jgi:hypothetical protein
MQDIVLVPDASRCGKAECRVGEALEPFSKATAKIDVPVRVATERYVF